MMHPDSLHSWLQLVRETVENKVRNKFLRLWFSFQETVFACGAGLPEQSTINPCMVGSNVRILVPEVGDVYLSEPRLGCLVHSWDVKACWWLSSSFTKGLGGTLLENYCLFRLTLFTYSTHSTFLCPLSRGRFLVFRQRQPDHKQS
jgi:hypothetical protein